VGKKNIHALKLEYNSILTSFIVHEYSNEPRLHTLILY